MGSKDGKHGAQPLLLWRDLFCIFVYEWSGNNQLVALFGAVNESTWEHLKMAFWPAFTIALIAWLKWGRGRKNFCLAQLANLYAIPLLIIVLFYGYQAIFGENNLIYDIGTFILAIIAGHYLSYRLLQSGRDYGASLISGLLILILVLMFSAFTYWPPDNILFYNPLS